MKDNFPMSLIDDVLNNHSPAFFCRYVTVTLRDLIQAQTIFVYMDDIIVPSKNDYEGLKALESVASALH